MVKMGLFHDANSAIFNLALIDLVTMATMTGFAVMMLLDVALG